MGRGAMNVLTRGDNTSYFFKDNKYVKIQWTPGYGGDKVTYGPTEFAKEWSTLRETGFTHIDAILPIPEAKDYTAYFFCGEKYARIHFTPSQPGDQVLGGVRTITSNWKSLAKAGFEHVDAAMIVPGTTDQAFIFSGNEFCRVSFKEASGSADELLDGPHSIRDRWEALGFRRIDTILPHPTSSNHAYVFSGDQAARIVFVPGGGIDCDISPRKAADYWPSLHNAGFY